MDALVIAAAIGTPTLLCGGAFGLIWKNFGSRFTSLENVIHDDKGNLLITTKKDFEDYKKNSQKDFCRKIDQLLNRFDKLETVLFSKVDQAENKREDTRGKVLERWEKILVFIGSTETSLTGFENRIEKLETKGETK